MSRTAVIGPKLLATCSTRSTSSGADVGPTTISVAAGASATARTRSHPRDVRVERHRDQDREAQVEQEVVGADALDVQPFLENPQEDRADEGSHDGARSTLQQGPADDRGGDRLEEDRV